MRSWLSTDESRADNCGLRGVLGNALAMRVNQHAAILFEKRSRRPALEKIENEAVRDALEAQTQAWLLSRAHK